jgi:hypothetical protein
MANISEYESFQRRVENNLTAHSATLGSHTRDIASLQESSLSAVQDRASLRADVDLKALQTYVDNLSEQINSVKCTADAASPAIAADATAQALEVLRSDQAATQSDLHNFTQSTEGSLQSIQRSLDTKATLHDLSLKHDTAAAEALLTDLSTHVQRRATGARVQGIEEHLEANKAWQALLERKVEVALAFVEWFGEKGETYEYNAGSLERHMNALARGNRATVHGSGV